MESDWMRVMATILQCGFYVVNTYLSKMAATLPTGDGIDREGMEEEALVAMDTGELSDEEGGLLRPNKTLVRRTSPPAFSVSLWGDLHDQLCSG